MDRLEKALEYLMERLSKNVEKVKNNSALAKELIARDPFAEGLEAIRAENKMILDENKELLSLQISIRKFMSIFSKRDTRLVKQTMRDQKSVEEWCGLTQRGGIKLDESHPMANNIEFLNEMLSYYKENEEYENCMIVVKLIQSVNQTF